ncbi:hypothetical protein [Chondrinema litorale]|uniref:hypothetical protein n=1 Tax=Chondrinema litorale TaxID=2994555 RepID=UPI002542DE07|nr:hypothetical protein [Chondrinema litorale]UZR94517.1 hypothetical protein OQ292_01620 [Chondrinema litorale]
MKLYTEVRNNKGKVNFRLLFNEDKKIIQTIWLGYQQMDDIKRGVAKIINFLNENPDHYYGHINDVSGLKKLWSAKKDKFGGVFVPNIRALGITYQAEIKSDEQLLESPDNHYPLINIGDIGYNIFKTVDDAMLWLIGQNQLHLV